MRKLPPPVALVLAAALALSPIQEPAQAQPAPAEAPLTLRRAVDLALAASPDLAAARLQVEASRARVDVARLQPNPELTFEESLETPKDAVTLAKTVETAGKRRRRVALAEAGAASGEAELARAAADVRNRVRRAFYSLLAAERRLAETEAERSLAERTLDVARERFDSGDVPRLDVLQAELATAQADTERQSAEGLLAATRAGLNTLLARPPAAPIAVSGGLEEGTVPVPDTAAEIALTASTELAALDLGIVEQTARLALARAEQVPDPTVQGSVTHRAEPEFDWGWRAALTIPLPLSRRRGSAARVEERTLAALQAAREARAAEIRGEVYAAAARAAAGRGQVERFRDEILPRAAEVESMAEDSYHSGQTGLPALLQTLQTTREVRRRALQAGIDYQDALADLESAMGTPLP
jgi:cobalt-zinc-cadmium efflux system outer membrane protein